MKWPQRIVEKYLGGTPKNPFLDKAKWGLGVPPKDFWDWTGLNLEAQYDCYTILSVSGKYRRMWQGDHWKLFIIATYKLNCECLTECPPINEVDHQAAGHNAPMGDFKIDLECNRQAPCDDIDEWVACLGSDTCEVSDTFDMPPDPNPPEAYLSNVGPGAWPTEYRWVWNDPLLNPVTELNNQIEDSLLDWASDAINFNKLCGTMVAGCGDE